MSLFDDESSGSSSDAEDTGRLLNVTKNPPATPPSTSTRALPASSVGSLRRTLGHAPLLQKASLGKKENTTAPEKSVFGDSIAEALKLRKGMREDLLVKRLNQQREAEKDDAELVEKDLAVAPFVTPAYRKILRERTSKAKESGKDVEEEEEENLLDRYIMEIEKTHSSKGSLPSTSGQDNEGVGNYYDRQMYTSITAEQKESEANVTHQVLEEKAAPMPEVEKPSLAELKEKIPSPPDHATSNSVAGQHEREVFVMRELRKRRRVDATFIEAAAKRSEDRMRRKLQNFGIRV